MVNPRGIYRPSQIHLHSRKTPILARIRNFWFGNSIRTYVNRFTAIRFAFQIFFLPFSETIHLFKSKIILDYFENPSSCYTTDFGKEQNMASTLCSPDTGEYYRMGERGGTSFFLIELVDVACVGREFMFDF